MLYINCGSVYINLVTLGHDVLVTSLSVTDLGQLVALGEKTSLEAELEFVDMAFYEHNVREEEGLELAATTSTNNNVLEQYTYTVQTKLLTRLHHHYSQEIRQEEALLQVGVSNSELPSKEP